MIDAASELRDLASPSGNHLEKFEGDRQSGDGHSRSGDADRGDLSRAARDHDGHRVAVGAVLQHVGGVLGEYAIALRAGGHRRSRGGQDRSRRSSAGASPPNKAPVRCRDGHTTSSAKAIREKTGLSRRELLAGEAGWRHPFGRPSGKSSVSLRIYLRRVSGTPPDPVLLRLAGSRRAARKRPTRADLLGGPPR
jgi:hypothetical protein